MDELPRVKKKINWDKLIYFTILALIGFFVIRYAYFQIFYIEGQGQVIFEETKIRVPDDITIEHFYVQQGDSIKEGDTLFSYIPADYEDDAADMAVSLSQGAGTKTPSWVEREIYELNKTIQKRRVEIIEAQGLIKKKEEKIDELRNAVILEISSKNQIDQLERDIIQLNEEIKKLQNYIGVDYRMLTKLQNLTPLADSLQQQNLNASSSGGGNETHGLKYYISRTHGHITRIYMSDYEVALKSENILNLHRKEHIYIKAFFDQEDVQYINEGDDVSVIFPDGTVSKGKISRFYYATYSLPEEFQQKYEPTQRAIAADIFPIEKEAEIKWKAFYKMGVKIRKTKR